MFTYAQHYPCIEIGIFIFIPDVRVNKQIYIHSQPQYLQQKEVDLITDFFNHVLR